MAKPKETITTEMWGCDHPTTAKERAAARRHYKTYFGEAPKELSPQFVTAWAYALGLAGGVDCEVCQRKIAEGLSRTLDPDPRWN